MRLVDPRVPGLVLAVLLPAGCASRAGTAPATAPPAAAQPAGGAVPPTAAAAPRAPTHVRMATQGAAVDAASFVAFDRGYFREAGVDLEYVQFSNASEMIPA